MVAEPTEVLSMMNEGDISEDLRSILDAIRKTIENGKAVIGQNNPKTGWEYRGPEITSKISKLEEEVNKTKFKVIQTTVFHLISGGLLHNPTGHLFIFPLRGTASFEHDDLIRPRHYIQDTRKIIGENLDLIVVAMIKKMTEDG